jgi:hypothetical protein
MQEKKSGLRRAKIRHFAGPNRRARRHPANLFAMLLCVFPFISIIFWSYIDGVLSDAWNPIRHKTEEAFFRSGSHERSMTIEEMQKKIDEIRKRRHETAFDSTHSFVKSHISNYTGLHHDGKTILHKRPNILFLFADDLGEVLSSRCFQFYPPVL